MAVLIANDRPPRRRDEPRRYTPERHIPLFPTAERPAIESQPVVPPQPGDRDGGGDVPS
jgi:hypothetical protein